MRKLRKRVGQSRAGGFGRGMVRGDNLGQVGPSSHADMETLLCPPSPCRLNFSTTRDTLTYAQAQKMVETELEGRLHRINICEQLSVVTEDEMLAQDLTECNSNKENSEQRRGNKQAASKSKRKDGKHAAKKKSSSQYGLQNQVAHIQTPLPKPTFRKVDTFTASEAPPLPVAYYRYMEKSGEELDNEAEYDMDEEDMAWLEMVNQKRVSDGHASVPPDTFELLIDRLERESILESRSQTLSQSTIDEDAYCCVCLDDECLNSNVILFCDICNLAVHQECYGVPYIPEGQWLCRRCLQSPSRPIDCVLCPNQGGAFKQTSDGSWAHVICAIWIPEVCFANTVFLEPVEGVKNIPPARWKLTCYLCKQKGRGASIQCHKANCYRAFHVTCAQRAGLYMKIDPVRETGANGTTFTVKKTAYCENHLPPGTGTEGDEDNGLVGGRGNRGQRSYTLGPPLQQNQNGRKKGSAAQQKKTQKNPAGASRKTGVPLLLVPQIPSFRLNKLCTGVSVDRKNQFMQRLHNYWLLKRHSRNGVPLIRRLHSHLQAQKSEQREPDAKLQDVREELKYWQKLRQDLEKARLLIELIRKRERLKREQMKLQQATLKMQLTPALVFLHSTLEQLQEKDTDHIFTTPVNLKEVPDYLEFVSEPMDFSTMRDKLEAHKYSSVADLESDFNLMISNCLRYNSNDTVFHKAAMQLREVGRAILRHAQLQALSIGLDPITGMHLSEKPSTHNATVSWWDEVDLLLDPENRVHMSPEDQLKTLLDKLDLMSSMRTSGGRTKRMRLLRREINSLRHKISHQDRNSRLLNRKMKEEKSDEMDYITSNTAEDPKKSTLQKVQEPTCPASSPLPGDAPPNPPMFCLKVGRTTTAQSNKTGSRKQRAKGKERGLKENHDQTLEEDENFHTKEQDPSTQEDAVIRVSSTETPSDSPKMGVGRRTSILFKKAKNRTRLAKDKPVLLQNGVSKAENVASSEQTTTAKLLSASPAPKSPSPSPHQLRSRGLSTCSDSEGEKAHSPPEENGFTNGLQRHSGNSSDSESCTPTFPAHSSSPPKRSHGKPALSKVPVGEEEDGVSNASKETSQNDEMEPLTLVWAKCLGYPSYPAMIVNPNMPREGILHNGIPIPVPPKDVLDLGKRRKEETEEKLFLVLFFDTKRTWQWLPLDKLHHMGIDDTVDRLRLMEGKKPNVRKSVHMAYDRAMTHLSHVKENSTFNPSNFI
ncbi:bromodomain and PHD finger-containing protein 3-like isoform X2 [Sinocyclocheilus anshuiensis]|uniref:bromodomain and PHD finger-containing protein 3-like isoform X2 n=1 Tax=Sinocyclocheilus anshuiensis TaxID=1608454 RepID=UPI0007B9D850|nr:PREDICTED: bromodomain and PHD finger-containing protein 3-like isoform X2 [Sinocyclocheilus anshuiensis]